MRDYCATAGDAEHKPKFTRPPGCLGRVAWGAKIMKRLYLVLLCLGVWSTQVLTASADLRCQIRNSSFVLDETDFNAIKAGAEAARRDQNFMGPVVTEETFDLLSQGTRADICESRLFARLFKAGKGPQGCVPDWSQLYFSKSEWDEFFRAHIRCPAKQR